MELTNEFTVGVPIDEAWRVLTDVERIAPCMPGAQLQEIEGDEYRGIVKVKVGPITAEYKGVARFVDLDEVGHVAVLRAEGRETRGQGNANATITARLQPRDDRTHVSVVTDLTVTGRVAQFGRGVLADVSAKLLGQFADCLESSVLTSAAGDVPAGPGDAPATDTVVEPSGPRTIDAPEPKPVDLVHTAGAPVAKRVAPLAALLAVGWLVRLFLKRRRRRG
jgi:hypothetical protein